MRVKTIVEEDFEYYKEPVMLVAAIGCSFKCCREAGIPNSICLNEAWSRKPAWSVDDDGIVNRYLANPINKALCFGGLEPLDQFDEVVALISRFRDDPIIIYTGYTEDEVASKIAVLAAFSNVLIKFGRFVPDQPHHVDPLLGVELASPNQYAKRLEDIKYESKCE